MVLRVRAFSFSTILSRLLVTAAVVVAALVGAPGAWAQATVYGPRTEVVDGAVVRYGFGGDFQSLGFGLSGFVAGRAQYRDPVPRYRMPNDYSLEIFGAGIQYDESTPAAAQARWYLSGPTVLPRRTSWYTTRPSFPFRVAVPRCTRVTFYVVDATNFGGTFTVTTDNPTGAQSVTVSAYSEGAYISFNQTVGSVNYTFSAAGTSSTPVTVLGGVMFDEVPGACELSRPATPPFTLPAAGGDAELLFNAGGNLSALGFGHRGYYIPAGENGSPAAQAPMSTGYAVSFPTSVSLGSFDYPTYDQRTISAPVAGAARSPVAMTGRNGGELTVSVTVPRCSVVRLYLIDQFQNLRSGEVRRPGRATVRIESNLDKGVYVTFRQTEPVATYTVARGEGSGNMPTLGMTIDDDAACTVSWETNGAATLRRGAGGLFRSDAIDVGANGFVLGGFESYPARSTLNSDDPSTFGYSVSWPVPPGNAWTDPAPAGYPVERLLSPPGGEPRLNAWFGDGTLTFDVVVPRCARVTFYFLDYGSTERRLVIQRDGAALFAVSQSFETGVYATFEQRTATARYVIRNTAGANPVLSGVFFDPASSSCAFVGPPTPAPPPPSPPSTPRPPSYEPPATTRAASAASSDGDDSTVTIAVVVAVCAIVIVAIVAGVVLFLASRGNRGPTTDDAPPPDQNTGPEMDTRAASAAVVVGGVIQDSCQSQATKESPAQPPPAPYGTAGSYGYGYGYPETRPPGAPPPAYGYPVYPPPQAANPMMGAADDVEAVPTYPAGV